MYPIDEKDVVVELEDVPQSSVGSPRPLVMADEQMRVLVYYLQEPEIWQLPEAERAVSGDESFAIVMLKRCRAHMFGPPNDEAFNGQPLYIRGLRPYGAYRIEHSSWIRQLERMNSVHPQHRREIYEHLEHLVFAFHDSTFECVCHGFEIKKGRARSLQDMLKEVVPLFQ